MPHDRALRAVKGEDAIRALKMAGFDVAASHHILRHRTDPRRSTVVAVHAGKDIKRGWLRKIISDAGLTVDEFNALL